MSRSVTLDETIEVERPLEEAFAYVSEFSRIEEWDPAVRRATRLGHGPPGLDSKYRIDMKAGFSLHYRVIEWQPGERMLMSVQSRLFGAQEEISFSRHGTQTRIRYVAVFDFPAPLGALSRLFPSLMHGMGRRAMNGMKSALENRFPAPEGSATVALCDRLLLPGIWRFTRAGYRRARRNWKPVSASLAGRHVLITGATSGIGKAAALALAGMGASITLVARDAQKAERTMRQVRERSGSNGVRIEIADLSLMRDVHALVDRLLARGEPIDILVNNAGALFNPRKLTAEGLERSFALLLLSPYVLGERLHPLLVDSGSARVVNVLSAGMYLQRVLVDDLQSHLGTYSGAAAYARAKRALMILTEEWARRWNAAGITVNAMHPGWVDTPGVEKSLPVFHRITRGALRSPAEGADTIVWLAAATEAGVVTGKFWLDREPHPSHVFPHTRESATERRMLLVALDRFLQSTRTSSRAIAPGAGERAASSPSRP